MAHIAIANFTEEVGTGRKLCDNGLCVLHAEHIFGMLINRVQCRRAQNGVFAMATD